MRRTAVILLLTLPLWAGTLTKTFTFSSNDLIFTEYDQYTLVEMKGSDAVAQEGEPILPAFIHHFVIPPTAEVTNVEVVESEVEYLPGEYLLYPGQKPRPFSVKEDIPFVNPDPDIYNCAIYPEHQFESYPAGSKHGFQICALDLYPLQYFPKEGKLRLARRLEVRISYEEGIHPVKTISQRQFDVFSRAVRGLVSNPEDVDGYKPNVRPDGVDDINYAIITSSSYVNNFDNLTDWKTKKGYMADAFSTTWIYNNYVGDDNQEEIRLFIRDYYQNKGLIFAVLAGDYNIVPERDIRSNVQPYDIACDWYYADIDSNWNRDGDSYYGETIDVLADECYFDVYVGRAPIDNTTDITNFINKTIVFEKTPPTTGIKRIVLPSVQLWSGYHGRIVNNAIAAMFPSGWTALKLENQNQPATRNSINSNDPQFCHIAAHGDRNGTYSQYGSPVFTEADVNYLTNDLPFIVNSIACYPGHFDCTYDDCFAEMLMKRSSPSGAVNVMFNCRYGWGTPPQMGYSEKLDTTFYRALCYQDTFWVGVAHAVAKEHWRYWIWADYYWHYCATELNLFGDPELYMYLDTPTDLHATHPSEITPGTQDFTVTVTDSKAPVEDALVCCYKDGEVHETGRTDASGEVTLSINPQTAGQMDVTATAFNYLPYEGSTTVGIFEEPDQTAQVGIWVNPTVTKDRINIHYALNSEKELKVTIYNSIGSVVDNIDAGKVSGTGTLTWNGRNLAAGVYFVKIAYDNQTEISQVLVVR